MSTVAFWATASLLAAVWVGAIFFFLKAWWLLMRALLAYADENPWQERLKAGLWPPKQVALWKESPKALAFLKSGFLNLLLAMPFFMLLFAMDAYLAVLAP